MSASIVSSVIPFHYLTCCSTSPVPCLIISVCVFSLCFSSCLRQFIGSVGVGVMLPDLYFAFLYALCFAVLVATLFFLSFGLWTLFICFDLVQLCLILKLAFCSSLSCVLFSSVLNR